MSESRNNHRPRVARTPDKATLKSRRDRSSVVQKTAPSSPIWKTEPSVKAAGEALIQAGADVAAREARLLQLTSVAETARQKVISLRITWDERFAAYASSVESRAVKPEDLTNLGLPLLEESAYPLAPPLDVTVRYDLAASVIRILVKRPPGDHGCRIEISPNPVAPDSYKEIPGDGARRTVAGLPPGGYWIQAAMVGPEGLSAYSPPVFVRVR
jgi:hypothetical protein